MVLGVNEIPDSKAITAIPNIMESCQNAWHNRVSYRILPLGRKCDKATKARGFESMLP